MTSCVSDIELDRDNENQDFNKSMTKMLKSNTDEQRISYRMLNEQEKYLTWKRKLENLSNNSNFNKNQKEVIHEAILLINPSVFNDENKDYFKDITLKSWIEKAEKAFTRIELKYAFVNINDYPTQEEFNKILSRKSKQSIKDDSLSAISDCSCSTSDDWCIFDDCSTGWSCDGSDSGCGWYWLGACNGEC